MLLLIEVNLLLLRRRSDHRLLLLAKRLWLAWRRTDHWVDTGHHVRVRATQEGTLLTINVHGLVGSRVELTRWRSHELLLAWLSELRLLLHEG